MAWFFPQGSSKKIIIRDGKKFNDCYYVEYNKCPKELINKYNKPINRIIRFRR